MMYIEDIKDITSELLNFLGLEYSTLQVTEKNEKIYIQVIPKENVASLYIGFRGGNLNAIEHILKSIVFKKILPKNLFLSLDIDYYREKNNNKIIDILNSKIARLRESGEPQYMPFLSSSERRLVHMTVKENFSDKIETESFDDEEGKRVLKITKK